MPLIHLFYFHPFIETRPVIPQDCGRILAQGFVIFWLIDHPGTKGESNGSLQLSLHPATWIWLSDPANICIPWELFCSSLGLGHFQLWRHPFHALGLACSECLFAQWCLSVLARGTSNAVIPVSWGRSLGLIFTFLSPDQINQLRTTEMLPAGPGLL